MFRTRIVLAAVLAISITALAAPTSAQAVTAFGVTSQQRLVWFDTGSPGTVTREVAITGLGTNETVEALNVNPADGRVWVLVRRASDNAGYVGTIDPYSGAVSQLERLVADPLDGSSPYVNLGADEWSGDFDPERGGLHLISSTRANIAINTATARVTTYPALSGGIGGNEPCGLSFFRPLTNPDTVAVSYNFTTKERIYIGDPRVGSTITTGASNISSSNGAACSFDTTWDGAAFTVHHVASQPHLYSIDPVSGVYTSVGPIGTALTPIEDFALRTNVISIASPAVSASEGANAVVRLHRDGALGRTRVDWTSVASSAGAGDFALNGTVYFEAGVTELDVAIPLTADGLAEGAEGFSVAFATPFDTANASGSGVIQPGASAQVSITDIDTVRTPADTTKPYTYLMQPAALRLAAFRKSGVVTTWFVSEAVTGTVQLKLGAKVVGTAKLASKGPLVKVMRVKLTKPGAKLLAKAKGKRIKVLVQVTTRDAAGNVGIAKRTLVLIR